MGSRNATPLGCLVLMCFAVGCGSDEPAPANGGSSIARESVEDAAVSSASATASLEIETPDFSQAGSSEAQMPEMLVPVPTTSTIDAEVQPAALVGLPAMESVPLPSNSNPIGSRAFSELVEAYRAGQPEQWTRAEAAIHSQGCAALPALFEGLISPEKQTRELASMMLVQVLPSLIYAESPSQRPDVLVLAGKLREAIKDESAEVRVNVAVALSLFEGEGPALVPILEELLASELPHVRTMAVSALGGLGSSAATSLPQIERLSQSDSDDTTKAAALEALSHLRSLQ